MAVNWRNKGMTAAGRRYLIFSLDMILPALPAAELRNRATDLAGRLTRVLGEVC